MKELERLRSGKIFNPHSKELMDIKYKAHTLCKEYNSLDEKSLRRKEIIKELLGSTGKDVGFAGPMIFNYGINTSIGDNFYANFNFTCLDDGKITIGNNVMIGPNCSLMASSHPLIASERVNVVHPSGEVSTAEFSKGIIIEDDVWLACGVTVVDGVRIGKGSVIGAGSVVTRDIESGVLACGVPCKVIRKINSEDSKENLL